MIPWPELLISTTPPSRFHNLTDQALADLLGQADAVLKGAEAECKLLKDEFKSRGLGSLAISSADEDCDDEGEDA